MIVELIGAPGAGKTTLVPAVAAHFVGLGLSARTVVEAARPFARRTPAGAAAARLAPPPLARALLWQLFYHTSTAYRLRFFARHPRLVAYVLRSQRRRPIPAEERRHASHWFFVLTGQYEFLRAHARPGEWLIYDEGFAHRAVQLHASSDETPDAGQVARYVGLLPRPDLLVAVRAPWQLCAERVYRRGLWARFRHKGRAEVERYIRHAHRVVELALEPIRAGGWTLIEVDNGGADPAAPAAELRERLAALGPWPAGGPRPRQLARGGLP